MNNIPKVKVGIVAVSRDCFPESLSVNRREALVKAYTDKYGAADIYECPICIVESEIHMVQALDDLKKAGCNALCVYLGNFGPEIAETLLCFTLEGAEIFEYTKVLQDLDFAYVENLFREAFLPERFTLSAVYPEEEKEE